MFVIMLSATVLVYVPGLIWLHVWLYGAGVASLASIREVLMMGAVPFIAGDAMKALAVAAGAAVIPKTYDISEGE